MSSGLFGEGHLSAAMNFFMQSDRRDLSSKVQNLYVARTGIHAL
ncbi:phenylalanyl-tRNA synthetase, beta subunit [Alicyclobacillus hesperidum URH17-3-68]|nr:phenylalanyl-tRNA synthetase, beta subunit [Alicyclobacillus hesperidum URH17-3-68]